MRTYAEIMSQIKAEEAQEQEQRQADQRSGYITGRLVVDGNKVEIHQSDSLIYHAYSNAVIQVKNDDRFIPITHHEAVHTMSTDGWPLYAGKYARIKR